MSDIRRARKALVRRILEGDGKASPSERRAAFNLSGLAGPLVDKVAIEAYLVSDEDINAARASGFREDQIFEAQAVVVSGRSAGGLGIAGLAN
jgi:hypothetical protein